MREPHRTPPPRPGARARAPVPAQADGLLVLAPLAVEAAVLRTAVPDATVLRTGMGPRPAARAAATAAATAAGAVAVAGVCGALDPALAPGDLVVAEEVRGADGVTRCQTAPLVAHALRRQGLRVHIGPIVSCDHVAGGPERAELHRRGAIAVDMESAWLAGAAAGRPFAVVRAVADTGGSRLPLQLSFVTGGLQALASLRRAAPALARWAAAIGPREVVLAAPRSFCAGVDRAIEIVERALERYGPPVYVRHEIVHNTHVVKRLRTRGAVFIEDEREVPAGAVVVFSAHGSPPEAYRNSRTLGHRLIDATCPLVTKVHAEARRYAARDLPIVLIGHAGHQEVVGTTGEAPDHVRLVETEDEVDTLDIPEDAQVAYVTQTTLSIDDTRAVVDRLQRRFRNLVTPKSDDICYATQNRQDAVRELAERVDLVLVLGSPSSSNSNRLVEVARAQGVRAELIDDETELDPGWLVDVGAVGITAGASAPETLVQRIVEALAGLGAVVAREHVVTTESVSFNLPEEVRR